MEVQKTALKSDEVKSSAHKKLVQTTAGLQGFMDKLAKTVSVPKSVPEEGKGKESQSKENCARLGSTNNGTKTSFLCMANTTLRWNGGDTSLQVSLFYILKTVKKRHIPLFVLGGHVLYGP